MYVFYENSYVGDINEYYKVAVRERVTRRRKRRSRKISNIIVGKMQRIGLVAAFCLIIGLAGYIGAYNNVSAVKGLAFTAQAADETIYKTIVVQNGDTLWKIASTNAEPSKDIRKQIKEICELNGIEKSVIYPGQTILVPVPAHLT